MAPLIKLELLHLFVSCRQRVCLGLSLKMLMSYVRGDKRPSYFSEPLIGLTLCCTKTLSTVLLQHLPIFSVIFFRGGGL